MIAIDLICPVYKNVVEIERFFISLKAQKNVEIKRIVTPLTLTGDEQTDNEIRCILARENAVIFETDVKNFSHSLTREKAIREYCFEKTVVLTSQDVIFKDENSIFNLVSCLSDEVAYCYGRQVCEKKSIEKYVREKNYPKNSFTVDKSMVDKMQLMAFFSSDAFSCLDRDIFLKLGGYNGYDVMMNEDQLYSKILLDAGYKKTYCAEAEVVHFHKYTLKQLYFRYYETGKFYSKVKIFDEYKSTQSGLKLALYVLKKALMHFNIPVLLRWLPDMTARFLGMKKGKKQR